MRCGYVRLFQGDKHNIGPSTPLDPKIRNKIVSTDPSLNLSTLSEASETILRKQKFIRHALEDSSFVNIKYLIVENIIVCALRRKKLHAKKNNRPAANTRGCVFTTALKSITFKPQTIRSACIYSRYLHTRTTAFIMRKSN